MPFCDRGLIRAAHSLAHAGTVLSAGVLAPYAESQADRSTAIVGEILVRKGMVIHSDGEQISSSVLLLAPCPPGTECECQLPLSLLQRGQTLEKSLEQVLGDLPCSDPS